MPKVVDHQKQREKIIEAAKRVMLREGLNQTSVRKVADEMGISPGAMRHYFASQGELLESLLESIAQRMRQRFQNIDYKQEPLAYMRNFVEELLPLDEEKMQETEIWFAFISQSGADPKLQALNAATYRDLKALFARVIDGFIELKIADPHLQREVEIDRLYALVDGLALHKLMQVEHISNERMRAVIVRHLDSLCR